MKKTIDWKKLWDDFNSWMDNPKSKSPCKTCGHTESKWLDREWEEQQVKIQQLINAQVREIVKKKI